MRWFILLAIVALCDAGFSEQERWVLEDFEQGTGRWFVEAHQNRESEPLPLAQLETSHLTPSGQSQRAGLFLWRRAHEGEWARFIFPLNGAQLSARKATALTFTWVGDGSTASVTLSLVVERQGTERVFRAELPLPTGWQTERLAWDSFRDADGTPATVFVRYFTALRIERNGPFAPFFFVMDDVAVEVSAPSVPAVTARAVVDFQQEQGVTLLRWGAHWDPVAFELLQNATARKRIAELRLGLARVVVNEWLQGRSFEVAVRDVTAWARQVRRLDMVPLVTLTPMAPDDLPSGAFQQQAVFWAQRLAETVRLFEVFHRPAEPPLQLRPEVVAVYFASLQDAIKRVVPNAQVGGWGEGAAWRSRLTTLFAKSPRPDFLTLNFYGSHTASTSDEELMRAARETVSADLPDQVPLNRLDEWLRRLYPPSGVPLQVSECALNAARTKDGEPADNRVGTSFHAAWLAALFTAMAGKAESLVHYCLASNGWGLLDRQGTPQAAYWAVWACNTYFPAGTPLVAAASNYAPCLILAGRTATAGNVLVVNTHTAEMEVLLEAIGVERARLVRWRLLRERETPTYAEQKASPVVRLVLPSYGVAVVQFVW
ncbi:hypothetical protein HRbin17_01015 [bacterium HR17]|uniref:Uncharacterized protein n=1 Tax=Candidatus Fervidibacter japonicus TaxID=2035412 RepID=A0A2H5XBE3_9BACT|nr:hypothetical protein HRbin17_01015 [bacterium HR17]